MGYASKTVKLLRNVNIKLSEFDKMDKSSIGEISDKNIKFFEGINEAKILFAYCVREPIEMNIFFVTPKRLALNVLEMVADYYNSLDEWEFTADSIVEDLLLTDLIYDTDKKVIIPVVRAIIQERK